MINRRNNLCMKSNFDYRVMSYQTNCKSLKWMKIFIALLPYRIFVSCISLFLLFVGMMQIELPERNFDLIVNISYSIVLIYEIILRNKIKNEDATVYKLIRNYFIIFVMPYLLSYVLYSNYAATYLNAQQLNYIIAELAPSLTGAIIYSVLNLIYFWKRKDFWIKDENEDII